MVDFVSVVTPPVLVGPNGVPAEGDIYARVTSIIALDGVLVVPFQSHGKIRGGQFTDMGIGAYQLPVTPEGVAVELVCLITQEGPDGKRTKHTIRRTVAVPDQSTVTWDALIDVVPVETGGDYIVPPWVAASLEASVEAVAAASTATTKAAEAVAAAASVPSSGSIAADIATAIAPANAAVVSLPKRGGNRVVFLGDSITAAATSTQGPAGGNSQNLGDGYSTYATLLSRGRVIHARNAGVGGNTAAAMLARFDTDVTPYAPNTVVLLAGTNDTGVTTLASFKATMQAILAKIRAIGAAPVVGTIPPSDAVTPAGRKQQISLFNSWLKLWCSTENIPLIPFYSLLVDPATGGFKAGYASDGIHPQKPAVALMGQLAADTLAGVLPPFSPPIALDNIDANNLLANGLFLSKATQAGPPANGTATAGTGGSLAAGTYYYVVTENSKTGESLPNAVASATVAASGKVTLTAGAVGGAVSFNIYRGASGSGPFNLLDTVTSSGGGLPGGNYVDDGTKTPTATVAPTVENSRLPLSWSNAFANTFGLQFLTDPLVVGNYIRMTLTAASLTGISQSFTTGFAPGDVIALACWVRSNGGTGATVKINFSPSGSASPINALTGDTGWGLLYQTFTVPAGSTAMNVILQGSAGTGVIDFGQLTMYNLTAMGLV